MKNVTSIAAPLAAHWAVLDFVARQGDKGATLHEIAKALDAKPRTVSARLIDLKRRGAIVLKDSTRPSPYHRPARIWVITALGQE